MGKVYKLRTGAATQEATSSPTTSKRSPRHQRYHRKDEKPTPPPWSFRAQDRGYRCPRSRRRAPSTERLLNFEWVYCFISWTSVPVHMCAVLYRVYRVYHTAAVRIACLPLFARDLHFLKRRCKLYRTLSVARGSLHLSKLPSLQLGTVLGRMVALLPHSKQLALLRMKRVTSHVRYMKPFTRLDSSTYHAHPTYSCSHQSARKRTLNRVQQASTGALPSANARRGLTGVSTAPVARARRPILPAAHRGTPSSPIEFITHRGWTSTCGGEDWAHSAHAGAGAGRGRGRGCGLP
jgi:hypothetical protein